MDKKLVLSAAALVFSLSMLPARQAMAVTTGLDFAGGCPEAMDGVCSGRGGPNADTTNVAAILGVDESLVTFVGEGGPGFSITGLNSQGGTWAVTDPSITHLALKADGHFILAEVNDTSGDWMIAPSNWDLSLAFCPFEICNVADTNNRKGDRPIGPREYVDADFLSNGGQSADLSNVRGFAVVPVPAAVWLFGSGLLGLVGIARRRRS